MSFKPLHDWAVIRTSAEEEMTAGGLFIPDTAREKPQQGIVESIGPGAFEEEKYRKKTEEKKERRFIPTTVKPGDRVLYERYAGQTYTFEGEERILVRERDILGILPEQRSETASLTDKLQIPASTSAPGPTALMKSPAASPVTTAAPAPIRKTTRKKPAAKKAGKRAAGKKATKKKTLKKASGKTSTRAKKTPAKPAGRGGAGKKRAGKAGKKK